MVCKIVDTSYTNSINDKYIFIGEPVLVFGVYINTLYFIRYIRRLIMRIPKSDLKIWHQILLPNIGTEKFCVHDIKQYFDGMSPNHIGMMLRLMWFYGYTNKHGRDRSRNVIYYSLRTDV